MEKLCEKFAHLYDTNSRPILGKHLYIDASFPRKPGEKALLHHNFSFKDTAVYCLKFFYCINGTDAGQLNIYDGSVLIWSLAGSQGNSWSLATVSIMKSYGIKTTIVSENSRIQFSTIL